MTITITLGMIKSFGIILMILSAICFVAGDVPGHVGSRFWTGARWLVWPLMLLWFGFFLVKGLR